MTEGPGTDTSGRKFANVEEMWSKEVADEKARSSWYDKGASYWSGQEANLRGIMGGYPETSAPDLRESKGFLKLLRDTPTPPVFGTVLDCGAGIGRVTSGLLLHEFQIVDLVEPNERLLAAAQKEITDKRAERFMVSTLQNFRPEPQRYDVIWAQWVLLYLPDDDLVDFLNRCKVGLKNSSGVIIVKENVVINGDFLVDTEDCSISRTDALYKAVFERAGLRVLHELKQACWPKDLIPVKMYALRPVEVA